MPLVDLLVIILANNPGNNKTMLLFYRKEFNMTYWKVTDKTLMGLSIPGNVHF